MSSKNIKRVLYGVVALAMLLVAGRELLSTGLTSEAAMAGSLGVVFGFMAATGAG
jgi:hypothetical protein